MCMCNFTCKGRPRNDLGYTVSGGTLNPTHSLHTQWRCGQMAP